MESRTRPSICVLGLTQLCLIAFAPVGLFSAETSGRLGVTMDRVGQTDEGAPIHEYTLTNAQGLEVKLLSLGAMLTTVKVPDRNGRLDSVTLHLDSCEDYLRGHPVLGSVIGRFANRIGGAKFTIDGTEYPLTPNSRQNHIHGGKQGFQKIVWLGNEVRGKDWVGVSLQHSSPDGHEGYPGNLDVLILYRLTNQNELILKYLAKTDRPTHINMTNHAYWNLAGATSGDVLDHTLMINADSFLPTDDQKIPTGEIRSVDGTVMDFRTPTKIGARIDQVEDQNYDHCYVLNVSQNGELALAARAFEPTSGRVMEVFTTQPGVQLYTAKAMSDRYSADGVGYGPYSGFCLETQHYPNAPNEPDFPSTLLRPGQTYSQTTVHKFSLMEPSEEK